MIAASDEGSTVDKILISSCLLGEPVRYDGTPRGLDQPLLRQWHAEGRLIGICPEMAGGLPCPRPAAEIQGGQGAAVWRGTARVLTRDGGDVSAAFMAGAQQALSLCQRLGIRFALLKARSPSCGGQHNYDGSFSGTLVTGSGVTAALLRQQGIRCFDEQQLAQLAALLDRNPAR